MARTVRKRKAGEALERVPTRRALPRVRRQVHSPVATLSRSAAHMRFRPESTYRNMAQADFACKVLGNLSMVAPEGSAPLSTRFLRMLG